MTIQVTDKTFETEVLQADTPVLVDLWADWCGPCKAIAPVLEELESDYAGRLKVAKIDIESNQVIAKQLGVRSIPALMLFDKGNLVQSTVGVQPKAALAALVDAYVT